MMKPLLTQRQASILAFLKGYILENGYPPTVREIAAHFRISSPRGAKKHLDLLESKGYILKRPGSPRAIELRDEQQSIIKGLPILGWVRAGAPNLATQEIIGHFILDPSITQDRDAFVLQVRGDSMVEAGILDGDFAVVKPQNDVANGEIVVAIMDDEATLKRFYRDEDHIRLVPANAKLKPIVLTTDSEKFRILGKVVGIVRKL